MSQLPPQGVSNAPEWQQESSSIHNQYHHQYQHPIPFPPKPIQIQHHSSQPNLRQNTAQSLAQQRFHRPRPLDLDLSNHHQLCSPPARRSPSPGSPLPSPLGFAIANVEPVPSTSRFTRHNPPLSPLGVPSSAPTSPRFTDFDALPRSPISPLYSPPTRAIARILGAPSPIETRSPVSPRSPTEKLDELIATEGTYYHSDSSTPPSPENKVRHQERPGLVVPVLSLNKTRPNPASAKYTSASALTSVLNEIFPPNDGIRSPTEPSRITKKATHGLVPPRNPAMAGPKTVVARTEPLGAPLRNSSMDSAVSALSNRSQAQKGQDSHQPAHEIAHLIKTAGSPEAVIQYLVKDKHSQSQQNAQLWRLVDKQRAMILGLNKDLERALKDKERYRKKLKEIMASPDAAKIPNLTTEGDLDIPKPGLSVPAGTAEGPDSPTIDSMDSQKPSPIDMPLAPYPITPPADQPNAPLNPAADLFSHLPSMPNSQDHAIDGYDYEAHEKKADEERKQTQPEHMRELTFNFPPTPSRFLSSDAPRMPPPEDLPPAPPVPQHQPPPTVAILDATPTPGKDITQFPSPPGRKPPPAPLHLSKSSSAIETDSESDLDDILEVNEIVKDDEKRGRRRTREEDDRERAVTALREAETRSLSKKSKGGQPNLPLAQAQMSPQNRPPMPGSLAALLSPDRKIVAGPTRSPGLPASPRAGFMQGHTPPVSPRAAMLFQPGPPLSPRPPRTVIPTHPSTSPPPPPPIVVPQPLLLDPAPLVSAKHLATIKRETQTPAPSSPVKTGEATADEPGVFKGFVSEEHPDLLLPQNCFPLVEVKVASSRMKPSRASLISLTQLEEDPVFTLAIMSRADSRELWRVEKDSASLLKLDHKMKQCANFTVKTPERSLFSGHSPAKLDARRVALNYYLEQLVHADLDSTSALELSRYLSTNTLSPSSDDASPILDASSENTATGPGGRPFRTGYLTKRGKNFGGWKARFFVLDGPQLQYFEAPGGPQLGRIKLQNAQIGKQSSGQNDAQAPGADDNENQYRHAFLIMEPKKKDSLSHVKHVLCAESDWERDRWVEALLQWIDHKTDDEEEAVPYKPTKERRASATDQERRAAIAKKRATRQFHPSEMEGLVSVSYDSTQLQTGPPQGNPKRRQSAAFDNPPSGPQPPADRGENASSPHNAHGMPDAAFWTSKMIGMGLAPASTDDKKHKKRSFFGFGSKPRSSSDGQDSLFGDTGSSVNGTPPQSHYQGPVRQAFGAVLGDAVRYSPPSDANVPLPAVVYRCIQYLDTKNAVLEEGIFRLSGSNVIIKALRERFNTEGDVNLLTDETVYDIHAVASLLKLYLRELPTTILTHDLHNHFAGVSELSDQGGRIATYAELVQKLPQANSTLLKYLLAFLIKIIKHQDMNKMTVRNVGIVFSPTLNIPAPVFAAMLQNYQPIFGLRPEEYELPTPTSGSQSPSMPAPTAGVPHVAVGRTFDNSPARPGTAGTGVSPSRQRLIEAMERDHAVGHGQVGSHHIIGLTPSRGTPSPPAQFIARQNHEPQHLNPSQTQSQNFQAAPRPSYDSTASHDGAYHGPVPAYEQAVYGMNRRRESAVMVGGAMGLNPQGSKSRLREETRF